MRGGFEFRKLSSFCNLVTYVKARNCCKHVVVTGYSMGGFGAYQLGAHNGTMFDAIVVVAGYGCGTSETTGGTTSSSDGEEVPNKFGDFLNFVKPGLSEVRGVVIVAHAQGDRLSSFKDAEQIATVVNANGGNAKLLQVPDWEAMGGDWDRNRHSYFNFVFLSRHFMYPHLVEGLQRSTDKGQRE